MDVSIIIVNYNTEDLLRNCLQSVYKHTQDLSFEVIVSDNGSSDGSIEMLKDEFPQVVLIENKANLGFGAANNRGLAVAKGKYIFYLNSDTLLSNNAVKIFYDYWETSPEKDSLGALGANLLDEQMKVIHSYGEFPKLNKVLAETLRAIYGVTKLTLRKMFLGKEPPITNETSNFRDYMVGDVDDIIGADLFVKNSPLAIFDESFFMYCEETDMQEIMCQKGLRRVMIPGPQIIHLCGASSKEKGYKVLNQIEYFGTFSCINYNLSLVYYLKKRKACPIGIFLLKGMLLYLWLNPFLFGKTKPYILQLIKK